MIRPWHALLFVFAATILAGYGGEESISAADLDEAEQRWVAGAPAAYHWRADRVVSAGRRQRGALRDRRSTPDPLWLSRGPDPIRTSSRSTPRWSERARCPSVQPHAMQEVCSPCE